MPALIRHALPVAILAVVAARPAAAQEPIDLAPVVVTAPNRTPVEAARTGSSVTVLTREDLDADPRPTLAGTLERVPGIAAATRGAPGSSTDLSVRGFGADDLLLRIDGIEFADPGELRTQADVAQVLTGDVGRIEIVKGAQSALYGGEAVGGVIDAATGVARGDGVVARGFAEAGSFASVRGGATLGVGRADWDLAATAQGFRTDGFSAAPSGTEDDGARNVTVSATGSVDAGAALTFGGAFRFLDRETEIDRVSRGEVLDAPGDTAASRILAGRGYARHRALDGRLVNEVSLQQFASRREFEQAAFGDSVFEGDRTKLEWLATFAAADGVDLLAGADWTREAVETSDALEADSTIAGGFAQAVIEPLVGLTLTGAVRYDDHSDFGGFVTWRATAAWAATETTVLRGAVATGFRAPSNRELFTPEGPFGPVGNPDLEPEETLSWELGIDQTLVPGRLDASATYFEARTDELIEFVFGTGYAQVPGESLRRGAELGLDARLAPRLSATAAYTVLQAEDPDGARLDFAPRHDLSVGLRARPVEGLTLSASASYLSGVEDDGVRLDPFLLLNATAAYAVTEEVETYARVENALDQDYERVDGFATPGVSAFAGLRVRF